MLELQSLDDIFNKRIFRIPDYQRGYAWGTKQLIDFWEDIMNLDNSRLHYTGVLSIKKIEKDKWENWNDEKWLIEKRRYKPFHVVDGQQRLTTASIFLQSLMETVQSLPKNKNLDNDDIYLGTYQLKEIKEKFLVITQPPTNIIRTYKFGYEEDNPSFNYLRHQIFCEPKAGKIDETFYTLNLENAKKFFRENLEKLVRQEGDDELEKIYEKLTQRFMFNLYEISDDFDVFIAFETMNNRGKKLSDLELLKNRLIYLTTLYPDDEVGGNDKTKIRQNINNAWKEIYHQLGRNKHNPLNDDDFLRAHWLMYFKYSRKKGKEYIRFLLDEFFSPKNVFEKIDVTVNSLDEIKEIKEDLSEDNEDNEEVTTEIIITKSKLNIIEINDYVLSLQNSAKHWFNSYNPENNSDLSMNEQLLIDRLNRIGIGYFRPLVLSTFANEDITEDERIVLFNAIERFIFLAFRVSRAQSNYRNSSYYKAARELYKKEKNISEITLMLNKDLKWTFNDDNTFKHSYFRDFIYKRFKTSGNGYYGWNGLKYLLFEYEEKLMKNRNQPKISWKYFIKNEKDKVSIEHIYPQTADKKCWEQEFGHFLKEEQKNLNGTLGNLLPLSSSINSSLQNDCFDDKKHTKMDTNGIIIRNGYENGSYSEQEVSSLPNWTSEEIEKRGIRLLEFLEERWNIDFGDTKLDLLHLNFLNNKVQKS